MGEEDNSKKKRKKKKGKKRDSQRDLVEIKEEEIEEKTPEPPSHLTEIEKRRFLLKYARKKLEKRKLQRAKVRKEKLMSATNSSTESYGRAYIEKFMKEMEREQAFVTNKIKEALKAEEDEKNAMEEQNKANNDLLSGILSSDKASERKKSHKSLDRKPGRVNMLNIAVDDDVFNHGLIIEKTVKMSDKSCMTDWNMFESYLREEFVDDFVDDEGNETAMDIKVISGLMESTLKFGYPRELWEIEDSINPAPSPTAKRIRARQKAEEERKKKQNAKKEERRRLKAAEKERRRNMPHLSRKAAERVVTSGNFLTNFRRKSKWIERTLGINMEHMENMRDRNDDFFAVSSDDDDNEDDDDDVIDDIDVDIETQTTTQTQTKQKKAKRIKNYLQLKRVFACNKLSGRAIGNVNFSATNRDWFGATYFVANSKYSTDTNGCIGIWNFMLPTSPEYELSAQTMITSTHFHPTDTFLVFGSTINGQILMWDLRNNKSRPIQRSNFSNGHSAPVFEMSFLPNIKQKQAEIAKK